MNQTSKARINITQRMLDKSIIDANKSVVEFVERHLPSRGYENIAKGSRALVRACYDEGGESTPTEIRLYRRPRGDKLLSVQGLTKRAKAGDVVTFECEVMEPTPEEPDRYSRITVRVELGEPPTEINLIE